MDASAAVTYIRVNVPDPYAMSVHVDLSKSEQAVALAAKLISTRLYHLFHLCHLSCSFQPPYEIQVVEQHPTEGDHHD